MNGYNNPNVSRMGNFGAKKNYMKADDHSNDVNINDLLPEDPYKKQKQSRWVNESENKHQLHQQKLAKEESLFVPESFKQSGSINLGLQTTKNDANSNKNASLAKTKTMPQQRQQQHNQKQKKQNIKQQMIMDDDHKQNNRTGNGMRMHHGGNQMKPHVHDKKQPVAQPYFAPKAEDPFDKYLKKEAAKPIKPSYPQNNYNNNNKNAFAPQIQMRSQAQPQPQQNISHHVEPVFDCSVCGQLIGQEWTEDSKQRKYHNQCFVCCECGISLGSVGKYIKTGKGMTCRTCRDKQLQAQHAQH